MTARARSLVAAVVAALTVAAWAAPLATTASADGRARFDTRVFALIPRPGFPALAYVAPNGRVYEGTYVNPLGDSQASRVLEYTGDGAQQRSWTIHGQDLSKAHGVQAATTDSQGRLVLLDQTPARVILLDPRTGDQATYATFADLPVCPSAQETDLGCSPSMRDLLPFPDYAAWGTDGSLYVTDYQQAVIWRVSPGGGAAQPWFADRRLDGDLFGTAGIVMAPDHKTLYFTQASSAGGGEPNRSTSKLYALPIGVDGRPGVLRKVWEGQPADAADGFSIAQSGRFYIALAGNNQLVVVNPDGSEQTRFPQAPQVGTNGSSVPFDTPSNASFLGTRVMVANQSFAAGNAANQAILDVETGETGVPEFIPATAGVPPAAVSPGAPGGQTGAACVNGRSVAVPAPGRRGRRALALRVKVSGRRTTVLRGRALRRALKTGVGLANLPAGNVRVELTLRVRSRGKGKRRRLVRVLSIC